MKEAKFQLLENNDHGKFIYENGKRVEIEWKQNGKERKMEKMYKNNKKIMQYISV